MISAICSSILCRSVLAVAVLTLVAGCATNKDRLFDHGGGPTVAELWRQGPSGRGADDTTHRGLLDRRSELRRGIDDGALVDERIRYTREAANEIHSQFRRLPNPDLVMYVYPHLAGGTEQVPIPGYSTVFPLYSRTPYAMPGETARPWRQED